MFDYFIVMGKHYDRIVRSNGAIAQFRAGDLLPWFKAKKFKLVKTEFEGEFQILVRNGAERFIIESYLTTWVPNTLQIIKNLSDDDRNRLVEILELDLEAGDASSVNHEVTAEMQAQFDEQAAKIRELVSDPDYRFQTITGDASA
jgi:recombinational DNA repair protein RecT